MALYLDERFYQPVSALRVALVFLAVLSAIALPLIAIGLGAGDVVWRIVLLR